MEKKYITPQVHIIEVEMEQCILTDSYSNLTTLGVNDTDTTDEWD